MTLRSVVSVITWSWIQWNAKTVSTLSVRSAQTNWITTACRNVGTNMASQERSIESSRWNLRNFCSNARINVLKLSLIRTLRIISLIFAQWNSKSVQTNHVWGILKNLISKCISRFASMAKYPVHSAREHFKWKKFNFI